MIRSRIAEQASDDARVRPISGNGAALGSEAGDGSAAIRPLYGQYGAQDKRPEHDDERRSGSIAFRSASSCAHPE